MNAIFQSRKLGSIVGLMTFFAVAASSFAQSRIELGVPAYGGTGCPMGSASATLSPDNSQLSILFDSYQVEAGGMTGKRIDRKSCNVSIPIKIPQGYSVSIFKVDYRGFNSLPAGAKSTFNVEYFFAGGTGPKYTKNFYGPVDQDFLLNNTLMASAVIWSACGASVNLRTNSSMQVATNAYSEQALSTVDSIDIESGLIYHLQWRRCY